ncbi:NUDIX domain-containing protein [Candidatus Woesearchaeota archaeon]|nr:NUDIX domain-containing protein [Candidatus Woesearchaeota archaeon]
MRQEYVYHVDENDKVLGKVTRKEMREKNLLHRSTFILVFNTKGELLVHKRTMTKDIFPGYYALCVGGTVSYGEKYEESAYREAQEEIGAQDADLKFLFKFKFDNPKITRVYGYVFSLIYNRPLKLQKEELAYATFMPIKEVKELMKKESVCPDDIEIFNKYLKEFHGKK